MKHQEERPIASTAANNDKNDSTEIFCAINEDEEEPISKIYIGNTNDAQKAQL